MLQLAVVVDAAHVIVLLYVSVSLVGMFSLICFDTSVGVFHNGFSYNLLNCGYGLWNGAKNNMWNYLRWTDFLRLW